MTGETTMNDDGIAPQLREATTTDWSLLGLVIKSIKFQAILMITFIKFPPLLLYTCLTFVFNPYQSMRRCRRYLLSRIILLRDLALKDDRLLLVASLRKLAWCLFCAVYVSIVLFALLASAFMISGFVVSHLAHEPFGFKESLYFDYAKTSPEAFMPIKGKFLNHRTEIVVSMTLPESEYNKNLGMFQVRVDLLSVNDQILSTSKRVCMLRFRSEPIRIVKTFLKIVPLFLTGYVSETQTLELKFKGFVIKDLVHTSCLKVSIEQRAEFRPGAGVPEIYDASLMLVSEYSFLRRIIWSLRRTLFVLIGMCLFVTELVLALVFFTSLIIPRRSQRTQQRDRTPSINNSQARSR